MFNIKVDGTKIESNFWDIKESEDLKPVESEQSFVKKFNKKSLVFTMNGQPSQVKSQEKALRLSEVNPYQKTKAQPAYLLDSLTSSPHHSRSRKEEEMIQS